MDSMPFTIKKVGTSQLQRDASVLSHCTRALLSFLHGTPTFLMALRREPTAAQGYCLLCNVVHWFSRYFMTASFGS